MTLTEFLLARIAEDEKEAEFVRWQVEVEGDYDDPLEPWALSHHGEYDLLCIQPRRVLSETQAKRRLLEIHHEAPNRGRHPSYCASCDGLQGWPCATLRVLALPFADHPDYRQEWKP